MFGDNSTWRRRNEQFSVSIWNLFAYELSGRIPIFPSRSGHRRKGIATMQGCPEVRIESNHKPKRSQEEDGLTLIGPSDSMPLVWSESSSDQANLSFNGGNPSSAWKGQGTSRAERSGLRCFKPRAYRMTHFKRVTGVNTQRPWWPVLKPMTRDKTWWEYPKRDDVQSLPEHEKSAYIYSLDWWQKFK